MKKDYIFRNIKTLIPGKDQFELTFNGEEKWEGNKQIKSVIVKGGRADFFSAYFQVMEKNEEGCFFSIFSNTLTLERVNQEPTVTFVENNEKVILEFNGECLENISVSSEKKNETPSYPIEAVAKNQGSEIKPKENTKQEEISANKPDLVNEKRNPKNNFWQIATISSLVIIGLVGIIILWKKLKKRKN